MAVGDAHVFPGFLTPVLTQLFLPKPPTTFLTCFCRGERRKYAGKKSRHNHQFMRTTRSPLSHPGGKEESEKVVNGLKERNENQAMEILRDRHTKWFSQSEVVLHSILEDRRGGLVLRAPAS